MTTALLIAPTDDRTPAERALDAALSGVSVNTCRVYTRHLKNFLHYLATMGHPFTREYVERYMATVAQGVSYNQALSAIKRLAMQAAAHGWVPYEIAVQIDSIRTKKQLGVRAGNWLTLAQATALLASVDARTIPGKRDLAVLSVLTGCGVRREELAQLDWSQFQLRDNRWMFIDIVGKGGRVRSVAVPTWVCLALDSWRTACARSQGAIVRSIQQNGTINGSLSATAIWDIVVKYTSAVGVRVAPHDLRRTYAKLSRKGGAPLDVIQKSLGHASVRTTELYTDSGEGANAGDYFSL